MKQMNTSRSSVDCSTNPNDAVLFFFKLFYNSLVLGKLTVFQYKLKTKNFLSFSLRKYVTNIVSFGWYSCKHAQTGNTQSRLFGNW